jgi:penicillin-binding protein 1B
MTKRRSLKRPAKKTSVKTPRHGWALVRLIAFYAVLLVVALLAIWTFFLDIQVREKFDGKKWALPARVYAQPLELYEGLSLTPALLEQELNTLGYRMVSNVSAAGQYSKRVLSTRDASYQIHSRGFDFWDKRDEPIRFNVAIAENAVTRLNDIAGAQIPLQRLEPEEIGGIYPSNVQDRVLVKLADLPPLLGETLLAVEDKNFLDHHGVSPLSILRAAWVNVREGDVVQGGSTLTQQLVKNFYLTRERHLRRKAQEAIMSVLLEVHYSKSEILETYINEVFLGQSGVRAIHGFGLASHHYFRQPLRELEPRKIALLIGLVKGPSYFNPWRSPERARSRRDVVLGVMYQERLIDEETYQQALKSPLGIVEDTNTSLVSYPAFVDLVKRQLRQDYQEEDLRSEGLRIFTSLSPGVQRQAEKALSEGVKTLQERHNTKDLQGGIVVTSVGSGEVLAMVGNRQPRFEGFNRALDARRPIGSLVKPFVYLTALEQPQRYNLGSIISDEPLSMKAGDGQQWEPRNFDRVSHGDVPLWQALAKSYNQATARLGIEVGLKSVAATINSAGYEGRVPAVPALTLGSLDMTPFEVSGIYHTLAAEGVYTPLRAIREVLTATGEPLRRYPLQLQQRLSPQAAFQTQYAMQLVMQEGTGRSVMSRLPASLTLAGKTGTTNDQRDSWFAGFSGEHLATVWLGRDDNGATPLTGSTGALQVWAEFMRTLPTQSVNDFPPEGVSFEWFDNASGNLGSELCPEVTRLPVREEYRPQHTVNCQSGSNGDGKRWWQRGWD